MYPLDRDAIKALINLLLKRISEERVTLFFTDPSKITMPSTTLLNINKENGILMLMHDNSGLDFRAINLSEKSIYEAFADFARSIKESDLVYTEKDSLAVLNSILSEL